MAMRLVGRARAGSLLLGGPSGLGRRPFPGGGSSGESPAAVVVATLRKARAPAASPQCGGPWGLGPAGDRGVAGRGCKGLGAAAGRGRRPLDATLRPQPGQPRSRTGAHRDRVFSRSPARRVRAAPPPRKPGRRPRAQRPQRPYLPWDGHQGPNAASGLLGALLPGSVSRRTDYYRPAPPPSAQSTPRGEGGGAVGDVGRWTPGWAVAVDHLRGPSPTDTNQIPTAVRTLRGHRQSPSTFRLPLTPGTWASIPTS